MQNVAGRKLLHATVCHLVLYGCNFWCKRR